MRELQDMERAFQKYYLHWMTMSLFQTSTQHWCATISKIKFMCMTRWPYNIISLPISRELDRQDKTPSNNIQEEKTATQISIIQLWPQTLKVKDLRFNTSIIKNYTMNKTHQLASLNQASKAVNMRFRTLHRLSLKLDLINWRKSTIVL